MFKPDDDIHHAKAYVSFNLLSEILFVQASRYRDLWKERFEFQSLERDSVCSSFEAIVELFDVALFQSLERDSVCSSIEQMQDSMAGLTVSIS